MSRSARVAEDWARQVEVAGHRLLLDSVRYRDRLMRALAGCNY